MTPYMLTEFTSAPFDIIDGDRGKNYPKQDDFSDDGHCLFLNATNVTQNGFDFSTRQFISEHKDNVLRKGKLQRDDVVLTTRGTIGNTAFFNSSVTYDQMRINSGMVIFRCNKNEISPAYLYYFLRSSHFHSQVHSLRSGVAQPQLPIRDMKHIKIPLPKLSVQLSIASILSAYDELIENNRRRIQLLEQAARLLYKEWFVQLRFPGHEHTKVINGVPEGWEKEPLGEIAPLNYGKALKKDNRIPGPFPVYGSSGVIGTHKQAIVSGPAIVVGRKGNVGSIYWSKDDFFPIDTVYFITAKHCSIYLYYSLIHTSFISTDVAVPGLNKYFAQSRLILVPNKEILILFEQFATAIYDQKYFLEKCNQTLVKARDLLLPRLINREVSI